MSIIIYFRKDVNLMKRIVAVVFLGLMIVGLGAGCFKSKEMAYIDEIDKTGSEMAMISGEYVTFWEAPHSYPAWERDIRDLLEKERRWIRRIYEIKAPDEFKDEHKYYRLANQKFMWAGDALEMYLDTFDYDYLQVSVQYRESGNRYLERYARSMEEYLERNK